MFAYEFALNGLLINFIKECILFVCWLIQLLLLNCLGYILYMNYSLGSIEVGSRDTIFSAQRKYEFKRPRVPGPITSGCLAGRASKAKQMARLLGLDYGQMERLIQSVPFAMLLSPLNGFCTHPHCLLEQIESTRSFIHSISLVHWGCGLVLSITMLWPEHSALLVRTRARH